MAIKRLGAQRFSGLESDVNNLPLDADLIGAIFNSTDTLKFWIFNGTSWNESAGGGGITGLEPNSTILEYSEIITDYTTPTDATATSGTPANAIDGDTGTFWASSAGINESITLDMGSAQNCFSLAYFISTAELATMTETQFQIKSLQADPISLDDLKAYWKFDEAATPVLNQATGIGSTASLGTAADAVITGGTFQQPGIIDDSLEFNGTSDEGTIGSSLSQFNFMHNSTALWSIVFWYRKTSSGSGTQVVCATTETNSATGFSLFMNDLDGMSLQIQNSTGATTNVIAASTTNGFLPIDTDFHMVAATYDQSLVTDNYRISIDGGTPEVFTKKGNAPDNGNALRPLNFANNADTSPASFWGGRLDEFSIWNRVLSSEEITTLYKNGLANALLSTGVETVERTINKTALLPDVYNFIRFNGVNTQFITVEGSSGSSLVMAANELAVQVEIDPPLTTLHGQFTINGTNANLPLNGGDPTSSVIEDPIVNSVTYNNVGTPNDPALEKAIMWLETLDASNNVIKTKIKEGGVIVEKQVVPAEAQPSPLTTKGDLLTRDSTQEIRLPVSITDGDVLSADSAETSGLKWVTPAVPADTYEFIETVTTTGNQSSVLFTDTVEFDDYSEVLLLIDAGSSEAQSYGVRINGRATATYDASGQRVIKTAGQTILDVQNTNVMTIASLVLISGAQQSIVGKVSLQLNQNGNTPRVAISSWMNSQSVQGYELLAGTETTAMTSITSVQILANQGFFLDDSRFTLYKVKRS